MLRSGLNAVIVLHPILGNFTRPGSTVLDLCKATGVTAQVCMIEWQHRKSTGVESDCACVETVVPSLVQTFETQILNKKSDIVDSGEVKNAANVTFNIIQVHGAALYGLPGDLMKVFHPSSLHVAQFIPQYYCDKYQHEKVRHIPYTSWSDKWLARFSGLDVKALLVQKFVTYGLTIKTFKIKLSSVGMDSYKTQHFGKGEPDKFYYGTNLYRAMSDGSPGRSYREETMAVSLQNFETWAIHPRKTSHCSDCGGHKVWLVRKKFSCPWDSTSPRSFLDS